MCELNVTELFTFKWLITCYVNFTSMKNNSDLVKKDFLRTDYCKAEEGLLQWERHYYNQENRGKICKLHKGQATEFFFYREE